MKCREKVDMYDEEEITMTNGKKAIRGKCSSCGTVLCRIKREKREGYW